MDTVGFAIGTIVAAAGICALVVATFHPKPSSTPVFRLLSWPGVRANDRIAVPLALLITSMGATFLLTSFRGPWPLWASLPFLAMGMISAVVIGLRRSEA
jgi:hypothetical protein